MLFAAVLEQCGLHGEGLAIGDTPEPADAECRRARVRRSACRVAHQSSVDQSFVSRISFTLLRKPAA